MEIGSSGEQPIRDALAVRQNSFNRSSKGWPVLVSFALRGEKPFYIPRVDDFFKSAHENNIAYNETPLSGKYMKPAIQIFSVYILLATHSIFAKNNPDKGHLPANTYSVLDYGAVSDTAQFSTGAFQNAIDDCNKNGGGTVTVPRGDYKIGTIQLKSNVTLELQAGSTIWGDPNISHYAAPAKAIFGPGTYKSCLIAAYNASNIGIEGGGTIDGQGGSPSFIATVSAPNNSRLRPKIISFENCTNVTVRNVNLRNSAYWVQFYNKCIGVLLDNVTVNSFVNGNNDGIDIDSKNVRIINCTVNSGDDGICLKSTNSLLCMNVEVSNCKVSSCTNAIKCGTDSNTGFKNIYIHDCTIVSPLISPIFDYSGITDITNILTNISGLTLEIVDGG